jgi:hypothetical protein
MVHRETQSNYGIVLMLWDKLHCTRRLDVPQQAITIGVPALADPAAQTVGQLLALPMASLRPWARLDGSEPQPTSAPTSPRLLAE